MATHLSPVSETGTPRPAAVANVPTPPQVAVTAPRVRDPRLDFYRGIAMFIILCAHVPGNRWTGWIPARFGFSDATEIFVFCSGMASAIAFGGAFAKSGWWLGTARVAFRCWQVFWAHIGLFLAVATTMAALNLTGAFEKNYINALNLGHFFGDPAPQLVGLFTLTYVPNYFDILPMYLVVLALMPVMMGLARINLWLAAAASIGIWLLANPYIVGLGPAGVALPAEPWSERKWFFNPFGWQLLFFTGFAFMKGWLPAPPVSKWLVLAALGFVLLSMPWGSWKVLTWIGYWDPDLKATVQSHLPTIKEWRHKSDFGPLRYIHFLSLAYLGWVVAGEGGKRLMASGASWAARVWAVLLNVILKVGQQSLAVFVFSMWLARMIGWGLDQTNRDILTVAAANLIGFAMIIACAYVAAWFKSHPWRAKRA
ncbi:OpgC domain-containing protein [Aliisedimentitalea scapharcae]|uniref:OpgC domain-containing protein n=1 Tax=Aliisedimentitalea scapharcae TaxID=1524259 RepID=A0ABZ2XRK8_9RHOB|nr:OpgC domain-containing protein [Rhodobacteraceae bacterium M382]